MGKFSQIRKVQQQLDKKEEEVAPEPNDDAETNSDSSESDSEMEEMTEVEKEAEKKRAELWTNRERVLVLCSRGADMRTRHLMNDVKALLPHAKGDSKLDKQKSLTVVNEIAEMKNCTKIMYFESRKHKDVYLWLSNVENGPSIKFLVHNIHTMMEMKMSGNCLKASRPILSFDSTFDEKPHLTLIKHAIMQTFSTANHHPRSQPFIDHVFSFSMTPDEKIWFRNFQIVDESLQLQEVGPRFVLELIRIFDGSFEGSVLYDNPDYESPNAKRREIRKAGQGKYIEKQLHQKQILAKDAYVKEVMEEKIEDPVGEIYDTNRVLPEAAAAIAKKIDAPKRKKNKAPRKEKYIGAKLTTTTVA